jgi:glycosyltransferase involved in cell wall biosynthesis
MKAAIVHYSCPPVIGGVEIVIDLQARFLAREGFDVTVVAGRGNQTAAISAAIVPEISSEYPASAKMEPQLRQGKVPGEFFALKDRIKKKLRPLLADAHCCIVHNLLTMHLNLAATAALAELAAEKTSHYVAWSHDSTYLDPDCTIPHYGYPWDILRKPVPGVTYVAISHFRRKNLAKLFGVPASHITVVPNPVDLPFWLGLSETGRWLHQELRLWDQDLVLFTPTRVSRTKNIDLGIDILPELKKLVGKVKLLVTGAPDPHAPEAVAQLEGLRRRAKERGVARDVIFLSKMTAPDGTPLTRSREVVRDVYTLVDAVFLPSRYEGASLPLLEAGLLRLPAICSDIEVFQEVAGKGNALFVPLKERPEVIAARIVEFVRSIPTAGLYRRVLRDSVWDTTANRRFLLRLLAGRR